MFKIQKHFLKHQIWWTPPQHSMTFSCSAKWNYICFSTYSVCTSNLHIDSLHVIQPCCHATTHQLYASICVTLKQTVNSISALFTCKPLWAESTFWTESFSEGLSTCVAATEIMLLRIFTVSGHFISSCRFCEKVFSFFGEKKKQEHVPMLYWL